MAKPLENKVALVAGATRGAGRGIARMLGEAGATVYCTGRSVRGQPATPGRPETIEETAEMVTAAGGSGIPVRVDHTVVEQVEALFARVRREQGRLDILVNDIWGGDALTEWSTPFWKLSMEKGIRMLQQAVHAHIITSRYGVPLMIERGSGLIVEITDGDHLGYRVNLFYDLAKISAIRLTYAMAVDLRDHPGMTAVAVTPGYLRSEQMLDGFGVTEANWRDAVKKEKHFSESETPGYVGRAVAALAADPTVHEKTGKVLASWTLMREYGFRDEDGRQPDWGRYLDGVVADILERGPADAEERFILQVRFYQLHLDPSRAEETRRVADALEKVRATATPFSAF
jgi:NAD(P)-dependent dehydrogenase (short-subunit alcohol dehydrogenase family)